MKPLLSQHDLISEIAKRSRFSKSDIKIILDNFTELLEDLVREESNNFDDNSDSKLLLKSRGLGNLYSQRIKERKGSKGEQLPETTRVVWRLSENIRFAGRDLNEEFDVDEDFEDLDNIDN